MKQNYIFAANHRVKTRLTLCMKSYILSILSLGLLLTACDNEIEINAEYQDIPIVYGIIDGSEDTNFFRIQRGYLGTEAASASFNSTDSLYYTSVDASINEYNANGDLLRTIPLVEDQTSRALDTGLFTTEGFRLYRFDDPAAIEFNSNYEYEITLTTPSGATADSRTAIVGDIDLVTPPQPITNRIFNGLIRFYRASNAVVYETYLDFNYFEIDRNATPQKSETKTVHINLGRKVPNNNVGSSPEQVELDRFRLYDILAGSIEPAPDGVYRFFDDVTITVYAGGTDLYTYMQLNQPTTSLNQNQPEFPGINGGTGLFSSRNKTVRDSVDLQSTFKTGFYNSPVACDLRFSFIEGTDTCYCRNGVKYCE